MTSWQLQEAKARFSELVDCAAQEPQLITRRGVQTAVLLSFDEWQKLDSKSAATPAHGLAGVLSAEDRKKSDAFLKLLQSGPEFEIPPRGRMRMRKPVEF